MNALMNAAAVPLTMSSREIAELTGSSHFNVLATVRRLIGEGVISGNETPYTHPQNGQSYTEFRLSFRDTMVVVSGYSAELRARIIDRWQELERGGAPAALDLRDIRQLAPLALQLVQVVQEQQAQIEAQRPKVEFAEQVGAAENDQSIGDVAKALGTGERRLFAFLRDHGVLLANNLPLQRHIDCGRFRVSERPYRDPTTGEQRMRLQTRVTGRGLTFLQQLLAKAGETEGA